MSWCRRGALKVCVLGDQGVGKTSLVRQLAEGRFEELYITTVGAKARTVTVGGKVPGFSREWLQKLVLWDVTGHGGPEAAGPFLRGARAALVVADATRPDTQVNMWKWVEAVKGVDEAEVAQKGAGGVPMMLVINKTDIIGPDFDIGPVMELSHEYGIPFRLTSARTGRNVPAAFSDLASRLVRPWAANEAKAARSAPSRQLRRPTGRFDRWDFSAGYWPGDPGPAGWPGPHGSGVAGLAGRALG